MKSITRSMFFLSLFFATIVQGICPCICPYSVACVVGAVIGMTPRAMTEKAYGTVLGNKEASDQYKEIVRTALEQMGVENIEQVPIKKMNSVASYLVGDELFSFTMFGIWLNEDLLATCDEAERTFILYHEAAHYAKKYRKIDSSARPLLDK